MDESDHPLTDPITGSYPIEYRLDENVDAFKSFDGYAFEKVIVNDDKYKKISSDDIENIRSYFDDFYGVIRLEGIYDFDTSIITEGDYVRIETKEGEEIGDSTYGKYDNYSVYFFDRETLTLYYIHNNI